MRKLLGGLLLLPTPSFPSTLHENRKETENSIIPFALGIRDRESPIITCATDVKLIDFQITHYETVYKNTPRFTKVKHRL
jgi:hypothetical protein